jgi:aliphatic nitrilase
MGDQYPTIKVAAIQAAPVFLDREATVEKACQLIESAAKKGAKIVGFSESFIPTFPHWVNMIAPDKKRLGEFYLRLFQNAVELPSPTTDQLGDVARQNECYVVMGINEKRPGTMGTVYNSLMFIDDTGALMGQHRKLVPTFGERLVHGPSDGRSLRVFPTEYGRLGGLICGEHSNPLAKFTLLARGEAIHVAAWPAFMCDWGGDFIMQQYAYEGNLFIISASDYFSAEVREAIGEGAEAVKLGGGSSGIYGPRGQILAKAKPDQEEIVVAEINLADITKTKMIKDTVGHYNRFDLFKFFLNEEPQAPMNPGVDHDFVDDVE